MNEILMCVASSGIFFGAMALRGIFGYLKNKKISLDDVTFDWKKFLTGSIKPILLTLSIGALATLIIAFLTLVDSSGIEVQGLEQISVHNLLLGLFIADIGENEKTGGDAETLYVKVYMEKPVASKANTFEAKQRRVAVEIAEFSDNEGEIQGSGNLLGKTDWVNGEFNTETKAFTPASEVGE